MSASRRRLLSTRATTPGLTSPAHPTLSRSVRRRLVLAPVLLMLAASALATGEFAGAATATPAAGGRCTVTGATAVRASGTPLRCTRLATGLRWTAAATAGTPATAPASTAPAPAPAPAPAMARANLTGSCATASSTGDLFPQKATVVDAAGLRIRYERTYKVVDVLTPWRGARSPLRYVLVQCGTTRPELTGDLAGAQVIEIPVRTVSIMSTVMAPAFDALGAADRIVSVDNTDFYSTPSVVERIAAGKIIATGENDSANLERLIALKPSAVVTYGVSDASADGIDRLRKAGLPVILEAAYMEGTPLGRAEWIKFYGALTNQEATAEALYRTWSGDYRALAAKVANPARRPSVISGSMFRGTWFMPGGQSFAAQYIRDAGGSYAWSDDRTTGGIPLDFEAVLDKAWEASVWINAGFLWSSMRDAYRDDSRYARLIAAKSGNVWGNDRRTNANGGSDYFETATLRPDLLLADLVSIIHPEVLPDHQPIWYRRIPAN